MSNRHKKACKTGRWAEWVALWLLRLKGYRILEQRFKIKTGEIDLIAQKGQTLIAIEVKWRPTLSQAAESVTNAQKKRIERTLLYYISTRKISLEHQIRFDTILVCAKRYPVHIQNSWIMKK